MSLIHIIASYEISTAGRSWLELENGTILRMSGDIHGALEILQIKVSYRQKMVHRQGDFVLVAIYITVSPETGAIRKKTSDTIFYWKIITNGDIDGPQYDQDPL